MRKAYSFTIKATDYCNLACHYCYSPNTKTINSLKYELLERLIDRMQTEFDSEQHFQIVWHGSEPMAVGLHFYQEATRLFHKRLGKRVYQHIQTNLTLLDNDWMDFFVQEGFSVSTSIDGPKEIHDLHRVNYAGHGSFDKVVDGIASLCARSIPVAAITVVTRTNMQYADAIFKLAKDLSIPLRINPAIASLESKFCIPSDSYGHFLVKVGDAWLADKEYSFDIEPLRSMTLRLVTGQNFLCEQRELCYSGLTGIGTDGFLYPCNRFIGVKKLRLGHINKTSFKELPLLPISGKASQRHTNNQKCTTCQLVDVCHGGCMFHAHAIYGDAFREDYFCESYVILYQYIISHLDSILKKINNLPANSETRALAGVMDFPIA